MSLPDLSKEKRIGLDIETYDPDLTSNGPGVRRDGYVVGIAVAGETTGIKQYLPFAHETGNLYSKDQVINWAKKELCRPNQPKVGANLLYDLDFLYELGVPVSGPFEDVQVAEPLINENRRVYNLDSLGERYLNLGKADETLEDYCKKRKWRGKVQKHLWKIPGTIVSPYAIRDVELPLAVLRKQKKILLAENLVELYQLETRLIPLLLKMRRRGVRVDIKKTEILVHKLKKELAKKRKALNKFAGRTVDIWAAASIAKAFDKLGLKYPRTPKTKEPSFQKLWLERHDHPIAQLIVECRASDKFLGTFLEGSLLSMAVGDRVHCQFNQLKGDTFGAVTGRFSSSNPNLQFIPNRDPVRGPMIRGVFLPEPGELWGRSDYSQIELRILAHYARGKGSDDIRRSYTEHPDIDFHQMCADMANTSRKHAKTINFGIVYGMGVASTAKNLGMNKNQAKTFLDGYHDKLPFAKYTLQEVSRVAGQRGWIKTILNRRRRFDLWEPVDWDLAQGTTGTKDRDLMIDLVKRKREKARKENKKVPRPGVKRAGTYKALNALIQGSAADLMKKAMVDCDESGVYDILGAPLLTVHDELDNSVPNTKIGREAFEEQERIMAKTIPFKVPVLVDSDLGENWGEVK